MAKSPQAASRSPCRATRFTRPGRPSFRTRPFPSSTISASTCPPSRRLYINRFGIREGQAIQFFILMADQDDQYFYNNNGKPAGPLSLTEIGGIIAGGAITADTLVWKAGTPNWVAAKDVPELAALLPGPQTTPFSGPEKQLLGTWETAATAPDGSSAPAKLTVSLLAGEKLTGDLRIHAGRSGRRQRADLGDLVGRDGGRQPHQSDAEFHPFGQRRGAAHELDCAPRHGRQQHPAERSRRHFDQTRRRVTPQAEETCRRRELRDCTARFWGPAHKSRTEMVRRGGLAEVGLREAGPLPADGVAHELPPANQSLTLRRRGRLRIDRNSGRLDRLRLSRPWPTLRSWRRRQGSGARSDTSRAPVRQQADS